MTHLYLDVCCLNRPFDDQRQDRIRLEAEAVVLIFNRLEKRQWLWVSSSVVEYEIAQTPNAERRHRVKQLADRANSVTQPDSSALKRGNQLKRLGFMTYDALHIACAERAKADVFLTTDDKLLRLAARHSTALQVRVANPLQWLQEVTSADQ